ERSPRARRHHARARRAWLRQLRRRDRQLQWLSRPRVVDGAPAPDRRGSSRPRAAQRREQLTPSRSARPNMLVGRGSASVPSAQEVSMRDVAAERAEIEQAIEGKTLCSAFAETVARLGDADALVGKRPGGDTRYSWNDYRARVRDVAL